MSSVVLSARDLQSNVKDNGNIDEHVISKTSIDIANPNDFEIKASEPTIVDCTENEENSLTQHRSPTTNSFGSNNISIVTLDENDEDTSVIDSDSDADEVINYKSNFNSSPNGVVLVNKNIEAPNLCQASALCTNNDAKPNIGSIAVQNSSDITFGNKTFYQGPVTIKHFFYDKNKWKEAEPAGEDNPGYANHETDHFSGTEKDFPNAKDHPDEVQKKWKCTNKQALVGAVVTGVVVCSLLMLILILKSNGTLGNSSSSDIITDSAGPLRIISRSEWIAQPPDGDLVKLELPSTRVIIAHTATENCSTQAACTYRVRLIQTFHMESRGWDDIGYNFLVGGDGAVYVGRGWDLQGAHTKGYNTKSICIAFIGTFNKVVPPKRQLYAAQKMIEEGVKLNKLTPDYSLYGHRQLIASESPGLALYETIKRWKHWTDEIK